MIIFVLHPPPHLCFPYVGGTRSGNSSAARGMRVHLAGGPGAPVARAADDITRANRFRHAYRSAIGAFRGGTVELADLPRKCTQSITLSRRSDVRRRAKRPRSGGFSRKIQFRVSLLVTFRSTVNIQHPSRRYRSAIKVSLYFKPLLDGISSPFRGNSGSGVVFRLFLIRNVDVYFLKSIVLLPSVRPLSIYASARRRIIPPNDSLRGRPTELLAESQFRGKYSVRPSISERRNRDTFRRFALFVWTLEGEFCYTPRNRGF